MQKKRQANVISIKIINTFIVIETLTANAKLGMVGEKKLIKMNT